MTYNNYPVFNWTPVSELGGSVKPNNIMVGKPNNVRQFFNLGLYRSTFKQNFLCDFPTAFAIRSFFQSMQGQYGYFYLISYQRDMTLDANTLASATSINVYNFNQNYYKTNIVYIPTTQQICKVTNITNNANDVTLTLDTAITQALTAGQWIANVYFVRFQQDDLTMKYEQGYWTFELNFIEVLQ